MLSFTVILLSYHSMARRLRLPYMGPDEFLRRRINLSRPGPDHHGQGRGAGIVDDPSTIVDDQVGQRVVTAPLLGGGQHLEGGGPRPAGRRLRPFQTDRRQRVVWAQEPVEKADR